MIVAYNVVRILKDMFSAMDINTAVNYIFLFTKWLFTHCLIKNVLISVRSSHLEIKML